MGKVEVEYVGWHHPRGVVEVEESLVDSLLETGDYKLAGEKKNAKKKKEVNLASTIPTLKNSEKEIKAWIEEQGLPLEYNIKRDTKVEMLERIKIHLEK